MINLKLIKELFYDQQFIILIYLKNMQALSCQSTHTISLSESSQNIEPQFCSYQLIEVSQIKKGNICLIQSHICMIINISVSKPGKHGTYKYMMKGKDIFLGNFYEEIFRRSNTIPQFNIEKTSYLLLQDSNQIGLISGFRKDGDGQILQTSLDIELKEANYFIEQQFKIQNYGQLPVLQKVNRNLFKESSYQFLKAQKNGGFEEVEFDIVKCFGYSAIVEFRQKQKLIKLDNFYQVAELSKKSQLQVGQRNYPVYSQKQNKLDIMTLTMQNLLNQELSSLKINQEKKKDQISRQEIGIQSDSHQRQNQMKQARIQKLTIQCDQIEIFQRTIEKYETEQIYRHFICPISSQLMKKPVILTTCGHTFDKQMITKWIKQKNQACPICIKKTTLKDIVPNFVLTDLIATFLEVANLKKQTKINKKKQENDLN